MKYKRSSGIILHPTSFPGPDGMGDLGPEAYRWVDFLANTGCALWQILPLGPTGYGDSPYQCFSAFAGNPYLISSTLLLEDHLLTADDLVDRPVFPENSVDYGPVIQWKLKILDRAFIRFNKSTSKKLKTLFEEFQASEKEWLDDFALFMAIKESQGGCSWNLWPLGLRKREPAALEEFKNSNLDVIQRHMFRQFLFFRQWSTLRDYANQKGIKIIGDIPIFVAYDSSETWSNPEIFYLDSKGSPTVVAGVPPDYFSPTGQLWGNPLYRWDVHQKTNYAWWIKRIRSSLKMVDIIRLDHFRGFAAYWEIPADMPTAEKGRWVPGPGKDFFIAMEKELGDLPIIAEDLGEITRDVIELRDYFKLPGMKIFQFAFASDSQDPFLPHNYPQNCVAYTGTHDNDTSFSWYQTTSETERDFIRRYLARDGHDISWDMIRAVWSSVSMMALAPLQDFLSLGGEARMNFPGKPSGNWSWRLPVNGLNPFLQERIKDMNYLYDRTTIPMPKRKTTGVIPSGRIKSETES